MAIEYTLLLKEKKLTEEILVNKIESLGFSCSKIEQLTKGICINLIKEIGFSVFLIDAGNYPYNSWETTFFLGDFLFERALKFRMAMEYVSLEKRYNAMLRILFELTFELSEEAIFVSNEDTEVCFFRKDKSILINNESGIGSNDCFKYFIANREVNYK